MSSLMFLYTSGKNFFRNGSIDVTPPSQVNILNSVENFTQMHDSFIPIHSFFFFFFCLFPLYSPKLIKQVGWCFQVYVILFIRNGHATTCCTFLYFSLRLRATEKVNLDICQKQIVGNLLIMILAIIFKSVTIMPSKLCDTKGFVDSYSM